MSHKLRINLNNLKEVNAVPDMMRISNVKVVERSVMPKRTTTPAATLPEEVEVVAAVEEDVVHLVVEEEAVVARTTPHLSLKAHRLNLNLNHSHSPRCRRRRRPRSNRKLNSHSLNNSKDLEPLKAF